jgi:hypothetical protein
MPVRYSYFGHWAIDISSGAVVVQNPFACVKEVLMKLLLAGFISLLATAALAQPDNNNRPTNQTYLHSAQADLPKTDNVPVGGCMPIGLTARGDLVFPMQCRELIERERGPVAEQQLRMPEQRSQQEPPKVTPAEKDAATTVQTTAVQATTPQPSASQIPASQIPTGQTPAVQIPTGQTLTDQIQTGQTQTGQVLQPGRKRLSRAERRKKQANPGDPAPQVTGSTTRY